MGKMIETEDTTDPQYLIPVQGNPGYQEHQTCEVCGAEIEIKEVIWESGTHKRVSLRCPDCGEITVSNKENRMFRQRIKIIRNESSR